MTLNLTDDRRPRALVVQIREERQLIAHRFPMLDPRAHALVPSALEQDE